jgi:hypothetical protein
MALLVSVVAVAALVPALGARAAQPRIEIGYNNDDPEKGKALGFDYVELLVKDFTALSEEDFARFLAT